MSASERAPRAPAGLAASGRRLWLSVVGGLAAGYEFDEREQAVLGLACAQTDDVAGLERALARSSAIVVGSAGQERAHPALAEARQGRLAVARLLGDLQLPDADAAPRTAASRRGQRAAQVRWAQRDARLEARRGA